MKENRLKFQKADVESWATFLNVGHSLKETAKHFNVEYRTLLHYLINFGLYTPKKKCPKKKDYVLNHNYFEKIDTPEKAYFLGLMMSDGYIMTTLYNKEVGIALQSSDMYILKKLNSCISPEKSLSKYKNSYKWKVTSKKIYMDLTKYGITENKSHTSYVYPLIPKEFDRDFIRGYFDGDGCISIKSTGYNVISFCSNSLPFLKSLAKVLLLYGVQTRPIYSTSKNRKSIFHTLYISGGVNKSIFKKFLYENAKIFLIRKFEKFKGIPC